MVDLDSVEEGMRWVWRDPGDFSKVFRSATGVEPVSHVYLVIPQLPCITLPICLGGVYILKSRICTDTL